MRQMFDTSAARVFQAAQHEGRMATTLLASLFRHDKVTIAHVGDSRAYLIRGGKIKRLTTDHSYTALAGEAGPAAGAQRHDQSAPLHPDPQHRLRADVPL